MVAPGVFRRAAVAIRVRVIRSGVWSGLTGVRGGFFCETNIIPRASRVSGNVVKRPLVDGCVRGDDIGGSY